MANQEMPTIADLPQMFGASSTPPTLRAYAHSTENTPGCHAVIYQTNPATDGVTSPRAVELVDEATIRAARSGSRNEPSRGANLHCSSNPRLGSHIKLSRSVAHQVRLGRWIRMDPDGCLVPGEAGHRPATCCLTLGRIRLFRSATFRGTSLVSRAGIGTSCIVSGGAAA